MNGLVRTTITLPNDLYQSLRLQAFQQSTSFSGILKKKLSNGTHKTYDIFELKGSLNKYAKNAKGKSFQEMRKGFENYLATRHLARGNFPFPHVSAV